MSDLKPCPCGQTPQELHVTGEHSGSKWAYCYGSCCGQWEIEFYNGYNEYGNEESMSHAVEAWNENPRSDQQARIEALEKAARDVVELLAKEGLSSFEKQADVSVEEEVAELVQSVTKNGAGWIS